jgi:serine phosphatase RsbU (regulator of sigma subunit)
MSLLNISFLNEAIGEKNILNPAKVFDHVRNRLIGSLAQDGRQDGMDGVLVRFDANKSELSYVAANSQLILIRNKEQIETPFDKMPVGKSDWKSEFSEQTLSLMKGDMLYLCTDGYADQFGGVRGRKYKGGNLKKLLTSISSHPMADQKQMLENELLQWQGEQDQVDDICLVGIRI